MPPIELREFLPYLKSQTRKNGILIKLFTLLRTYHPTFESRGLTKEKIYHRLFPKEDYHDRKFWDTFSNLTGKLEEFLVIKEVKSDEYLHQKLLAQVYNRRNLYPFFVKKTKSLIKELDEAKVRDLETYLEMMVHHHQLFFHPDTPKFTATEKDLSAVMKNLDLFYVMAKLRYSCELIGREKYLAQQYDIQLLEEVSQLATDTMIDEHPLFDVYLKIIQLFSAGHEEKVFQQLKNIFLTEKLKIGRTEQQTILVYLLNHCIRLANKGNYQHNKDILELYKIGLSYGLLIEHDKMVDDIFTNIAIIGSFGNDLKWTEEFIEHYTIYLDDSNKTNAVKLSLGYWFFYKAYWGDDHTLYNETTKVLKEVDYHQIKYGLRAKSLLLRTYYECFLRNTEDNDYSFIQDFINAFEKYVKRNKILSPAKTKEYLNLISMVRKMTTLKYRIFYDTDKADRKALDVLIKKLSKIKHSTTHFWLNEKLKELDKLLQ